MKMREINKDVWAIYIVNKYKNNIIIDDLRFSNEFKYLKEDNYYLVRINIDKKLQIERLKNKYSDYKEHIKKLNHSSETELDDEINFNYIFNNKSNINLEKIANDILDCIENK